MRQRAHSLSIKCMGFGNSILLITPITSIMIKQEKYRCGKTVGYLLQSQNPRERS